MPPQRPLKSIGGLPMTLLSRYTTSSMASLLDEIYSLSSAIKPRYNSKSRFIREGDKSGKLEVELAGYLPDEIQVYTEDTSLVVSANKTDKSRKYYYSWYIAENERVGDVKYNNGLLTIEISLVEPEHPKRKFYDVK